MGLWGVQGKGNLVDALSFFRLLSPVTISIMPFRANELILFKSRVFFLFYFIFLAYTMMLVNAYVCIKKAQNVFTLSFHFFFLLCLDIRTIALLYLRFLTLCVEIECVFRCCCGLNCVPPKKRYFQVLTPQNLWMQPHVQIGSLQI